MRTEFTQANKDFSDKAHKAAQWLIYPYVFNATPDKITYETTDLGQSERGTRLDGEMAIDRVVRVQTPNLRQSLPFSVQERFRKPYAAKWKDITVTEWNNASNMPSELYKISALLFVYGYYNEQTNSFLDAIVVNVPALLFAIATGTVSYTRENNKKRQSFLGFSFDALHKAGVVVYRHGVQQRSAS